MRSERWQAETHMHRTVHCNNSMCCGNALCACFCLLFLLCFCFLVVTLLQGGIVMKNYAGRVEASWIYQELERVRNIRPGFRCVCCQGSVLAPADFRIGWAASTQGTFADVPHKQFHLVASQPTPILSHCHDACNYTIVALHVAFTCRWGLLGGLANAALTTYITRGKEPWTLKYRCGWDVVAFVCVCAGVCLNNTNNNAHNGLCFHP